MRAISLLALRSIGTVLLVALGAGLLMGFVTFLITQVIHLVFIFPLGIGFVAGLILNWAIHTYKMPSVRWAVVAGVLLTLSLYGMTHSLAYARFLGEVTSMLPAEARAVASEAINATLRDETGQPGFIGFLLYRAQQGLQFGRLFSSSSTPVGAVGTWLYWALELLMTGGVAIAMARLAARERFCAACHTWYRGTHVGSVHDLFGAPFLDCVHAQRFSEAREFIEATVSESPTLEVYVQYCPSCTTSPRFLSVKRASDNGKGSLHLDEVLQQPLSLAQHQALQEPMP